MNIFYCITELVIAQTIASVSLFADSADFLEDAVINLIVIVGLGRLHIDCSRLGKMLALILIIPSFVTLWMAWSKFDVPEAPNANLLSVTGIGALIVNLVCASLLVIHRGSNGSLTKAVFFSARNDVIGNIAVIFAGLVTSRLWSSPWPDVAAGLGIALLNVNSAYDVWKTAKAEHSVEG